MIVLPQQSFFAWRAGMTFLHLVAILSTLGRVFIRYRTKRMGLDDYFVVFPFIMDLFFFSTLFTGPLFSRNTMIPGQVPVSVNIPYIVFWYSLFPAMTVVWLSRITLSLSLIRAFPRHRIALGVPYFFAISYLCCIFAIMFGCRRPLPGQPGTIATATCLRPTNAPNGLGNEVQFSVDLLSDILLFAVPLFLLWRAKLPAKDRRMVLAAFSTSILTLATVIVLMVFVFAPFRIDRSTTLILQMLGHLEASIGLFACNLLIISTFLYRVLKGNKDGDTSHPTSSGRYPTNGISVVVRTHRSQDPGFHSGKGTDHTESHERDEPGDPSRLTYINLKPLGNSAVTKAELEADRDVDADVEIRKDNFEL